MAPPVTNHVNVTVNVNAAILPQRFQFGTPMGVFAHTVNANRQNGPFFSVAEVNAAGFTVGAEPQVNAWATSVFAQPNQVESVLIGLQAAGDAGDWTTTMDAIELAGSDTWYITNVESRAEADILAVAAWTEARRKIFVAQSSDAGILTATPGNVAEDLQGFSYNRTGLLYHSLNAEYADGAWSSSGGSMDLDTRAGSWAYRNLSGITPDELTGVESGNILTQNANWYSGVSGSPFTWKGTMASSRAFKTQTTIDWVTARIEEKILGLFLSAAAANGDIPYDESGIAIMQNGVQEVLDLGVTAGHFLPGPIVEAPLLQEIDPVDRQNGVLALQAQATFAGTIKTLNVTVNLQF